MLTGSLINVYTPASVLALHQLQFCVANYGDLDIRLERHGQIKRVSADFFLLFFPWEGGCLKGLKLFTLANARIAL